MKPQDPSSHFERITKIITYLQENFRNQPSLEELAELVHLSPFHFQRLFSEWAGTTPKRFLRYLTAEHAKTLLRQQQMSLFDTADATGLSGTGRLHDLFVQLEGMTPAEYKNGGKDLRISYDLIETHFGKALVAATDRGICTLHFTEKDEEAEIFLQKQFPQALLFRETHPHHQAVSRFFRPGNQDLPKLRLHLKATPFQLKVWESLLKIPPGKLCTYGDLARETGNPAASRAVGTAVGSNPIAILIPCHRVIRTTGIIGEYRWGSPRKAALIAWESAQNDPG